MKAIYTLINDQYYYLKQNTAEPVALSNQAPDNGASLTIDANCGEVTEAININTLSKDHLKSNAQLYNEMVDSLTQNKVKEIKTLYNFYKIYIDYAIYENGKEIDHSAVIKPISPEDKAMILGVGKNNECVYRRVKAFEHTISFTIRNTLPYGIISRKNGNYQLKIFSIALFEDKNYVSDDCHCSEYDHGYCFPSLSINTSIMDMPMVYSSEKEKMEFEPICLSFIPRKVNIKLSLILANLITVYDKATIDKILTTNNGGKNPYDDTTPETPESGKTDDDKTDDDKPDKPSEPTSKPVVDEEGSIIADGVNTPNADGWMDYYEKCRKTTPHALLVVADDAPKDTFDHTTMIRQKNVVKDLPDIQVGEYVVYRETIVDFAG